MSAGAALQSRVAAAVAAPFGGIEIESDGESITGLRFVPRVRAIEPAHELAARAAMQLAAYLADPHCDLRPAIEGARHGIPAPGMAGDRRDPLRCDAQLR